MLRILLLLPALVLISSAQLLVQPAAHPPLEHPAVIESQIFEHQYPQELLKSDKFYGNPRTAARLAQESWFTDKEHPVFEREADKIERGQISKIFINAGLHRRRRQI